MPHIMHLNETTNMPYIMYFQVSYCMQFVASFRKKLSVLFWLNVHDKMNLRIVIL